MSQWRVQVSLTDVRQFFSVCLLFGFKMFCILCPMLIVILIVARLLKARIVKPTERAIDGKRLFKHVLFEKMFKKATNWRMQYTVCNNRRTSGRHIFCNEDQMSLRWSPSETPMRVQGFSVVIGVLPDVALVVFVTPSSNDKTSSLPTGSSSEVVYLTKQKYGYESQRSWRTRTGLVVMVSSKLLLCTALHKQLFWSI